MQNKLSHEEVVVEGRITDHRQVSAGRGSYNYYLTYSYDYKGSTYSRNEPVKIEEQQITDLLAPHHAHLAKYIDTWTATELLP